MSGLFLAIVASWLASPDPSPRASDVWLGEMSYPIFLIHGPVIIGVQFALNATGIHLTFVAHLAILLILVAGIHPGVRQMRQDLGGDVLIYALI